MQEEKELIPEKNIQKRNINKKYMEWAVKHIWPLIKDDEDLLRYLPDKDMERKKYPDKGFTWGLLFTLRPTWANKYYNKVL